VTLPIQIGTDGNDILNGTDRKDILFGGKGDDTLNGGGGKDILAGDVGVDTLTGGKGKDAFVFTDNPFSGGEPAPAANGIKVLNKPDIITDYQIGEDKLVFRSGELGVENLNFQKGVSSQLSGQSNLLVLQDAFPNAAAAAKAIADNNAVTSDAGLFVYFNSTLGISRVVFSQDLSDGGPISVLANLTNQTNPANQANFSAKDFVLV
jgi:Ca2+-binding RTX toxin-like protein